MYLSDKKILELNNRKQILEPFNEDCLNPCSYDLRLSKECFLFPLEADTTPMNPHKPKMVYERKGLEGEQVLLKQGEFCLASTIEKVNLPDNIAAQVVGKSSIGRCGLFVHNAGHVDPGFKGTITLELYNAGPNIIDITSIERICQLVFIKVDGEVENSYAGKYQNQDRVTPPKADRKN